MFILQVQVEIGWRPCDFCVEEILNRFGSLIRLKIEIKLQSNGFIYACCMLCTFDQIGPIHVICCLHCQTTIVVIMRDRCCYMQYKYFHTNDDSV